MNDEWCFHCDEARIIGLFCSGEFNGEPCGGVWLNLPDRETCPRCGFDSLDYLRVDDDLKCSEHRDIGALDNRFFAHPFLEAAAARPIPPVGTHADRVEWERTRAVNIEGPQV